MSTKITDLGEESLAAFKEWCEGASEEKLFNAICEVRQGVFLARNKEQRSAVERFIDAAIEIFERRFGDWLTF